jgi:DNA-binding response OmpR family regulator
VIKTGIIPLKNKKDNFLKKRVLVIDDEKDILDVIETFLAKKGFDVISVETGEEGLDVLEKNRDIDVIVLDNRMPGLSGIEVLERLKENKNATPVIIFTGSMGRRIRLLSVSAFLMKPIRLETLFRTIKELV